MIEKITFRKLGIKIPIAASFILLPNLFFSQNAKQIREIKKLIDEKNTTALLKRIKDNTLSINDLKAKAKSLDIPFSGQVDGRTYQLSGFDKTTGKPIYYTTYNSGASFTTGVDYLRSDFGIFNLEGEGMTLHEWDGGAVLANHKEFQGRATQMDNAQINDHATHVGGTMVAGGVLSGAKGMAPKAKLEAYDWTNDQSEMVDAAEKRGALVSNHSYGAVGGFSWGDYSGQVGWHWLGDDQDTEYYYYGKYSNLDQNWDLISVNFPHYLMVKAAGNPRGNGPSEGGEHFVRVRNPNTNRLEWRASNKVRQKNGGLLGFDCIDRGSLGKNTLIVGAAHKIMKGYEKATDVVMGSFSAYGPVDDGRIKPDIAGVGVGVLSTTTSAVDSYSSMNGTSMAAPNVSGALILLQEHYKNLNNDKFMLSATLKALAINTANEAGDAPGPDYKSGWGLLNAYKAAQAISNKGKLSLIEEKTLNNGETQTISLKASGTEPLKITIAWTDPAPKEIPNADILNERKKTLVNDLDIKVSYNGEEYLPWKLDPAQPNNPATRGDNEVDNVEQILIENPVPGATYTLTIGHKGTLQKNTITSNTIGLENATEQNYSLVVTGINNNVKKDLEVSSIKIEENLLNYSTQTPISVKLTNKGSEEIQGAKLKYRLIDQDAQKEISAQEIDLENIVSGQVLDKMVYVDLSQSFVNYKIEASIVFAQDEIKENNVYGVYTFGTLANLSEKGSSHRFGFEDDLLKNGWNVEDVNGDARSWHKYDDEELAYEGKSFAVNLPANRYGTNDWLFSNPLKVKAGQVYRVVLQARKFRNFDEDIEIFMGDSPNSGAMNTPIGTKITITENAPYKKYHYEFTATEDKIIYIGFNSKKPATEASYAVAIDDVGFQNASGVPYVDFKAQKTSVNGYEIVELINETLSGNHLPISGYQWEFEPNNVTFQEGTSATSENPKVILNKEGNYKITLKATNAQGEGKLTRENYIEVKNTPTQASFTNAISSIEEGQSITFTNSSTGNPLPVEYLWTITPSESVEFISGTDSTSKNAVIQFNKYGKYKVALTAKSPHNEDKFEKEISVSGLYEGVRNLSHILTDNSNLNKNLSLKWERPNMKNLYDEGFEAEEVPADMTIIDANSDSFTWGISRGARNSGQYSLESKSWTRRTGGLNCDDWILTPKLRSGAEILKYAAKHEFKERYDIYVVTAPDSGKVPTLEQIKAGQKVYTFEAEEQSNQFVSREVNIKDYTGKDFYIAFHHRTTKEDDAVALYIDDVILGYNNEIPVKKSAVKENQDVSPKVKNEKNISENGNKIIVEEEKNSFGKAQNSIIEQYGIAQTPFVVGYEVIKNGVSVKNINDFNTKTYQEEITNAGTFIYDVYTLYSDGKKSDKKTISVEIPPITTLRVYPNPSDGEFVIENPSNVTSFKVTAHDFSARKVYEKEFSGNKVKLDLRNFATGIYIFNIVDNFGEKKEIRIVIQSPK